MKRWPPEILTIFAVFGGILSVATILTLSLWIGITSILIFIIGFSMYLTLTSSTEEK